jgi:DNA modification methylase
MDTNEPRYQFVGVDDLVPDPRNPRVISDLDLAHLRNSIREFGFVQPIVARRSDRLIIGGHQRLQAARQEGWSQVPVLWWQGDDRQARTLALALNRIQGEWDESKLAAVLGELADVDSLTEALLGFDTSWTDLAGFDSKEILRLLDAQLPTGAKREDLAGLSALLQKSSGAEAKAQSGDCYALGVHRLLCADARDEAGVLRLSDDCTPAILFTNPPYNVNYHAEASGGGSGTTGRKRGRRRKPLGAIEQDNLTDSEYAHLLGESLGNAARVMQPGGAIYVCGGTSTTTAYDRAFEATDFHKSSILVWDKSELTLGRKDYQSQFEFIYYGWLQGSSHHFYGGRNQTDIWVIPRDSASLYLHPTQKPVALAERAIRNSSVAGDYVLDLFAGSGSTLVAAELTGRRALLMEVDPHYVDVIIARWEALTGQQAERVSRAVNDA